MKSILPSRRLVFSLLSLFLVLLAISCSTTVNYDLIIRDVNIIDVETGEIVNNQTVGIDGDSIAKIYTKSPRISEFTKIIDGGNKFLIPGFWDMHAHNKGNYLDSNPLMIANGVIGIREMWGKMANHKKILQDVSAGTLDAPHIYLGSPIIDGVPSYWPGSIEVDNANTAREVAQSQIESGIDFLKVYSFLSKESFYEIAKVANERGVPFAGHVPLKVTIQEAAKLGMQSAEHLYGVSVGFSSKQDSIVANGIFEMNVTDLLRETFDEDKFNEVCDVLVEEELWICPTLVTSRGYANQYNPDFANDERLAYLESYLKEGWIGDKNDLKYPEVLEWDGISKRYHDYNLSLISKMHKKGVKFLAGSDYPNPFCMPGFSLHDEMALLVEAGMDNLSALQTSTLNPAMFMNKQKQFGSVDKGKKASLVLLSENPLEDIKNTNSIAAVILRGKLFERSQLDQLLEESKRKVQMPKYSTWIERNIQEYGLEVAMDSFDIMLNTPTSPYSLHPQYLIDLASRYTEKGAYEKAQAVFEKSILLYPDEDELHDGLANLYFQNENYNKALLSYRKVLDLDPYNAESVQMVDSIQMLLK